jgi:adhesin/invasin
VVFSAQAGTGTATVSGTTDNGNGTYSAVVTGVLAGTVTLKATLGGAAVPSTAAVTVSASTVASPATSTVSAPASIASGSPVQVTLQAKDAAGNPLSAGGAAVAFSVQSGTGTATVSAATDKGNGSYTATLSGVLAGTVTVRATLNGTSVTSTAAVTVTPGAASPSTSTITAPGQFPLGTSFSVTVNTKDAAGNPLTTGGAAVAFSQSGTGAVSFSGFSDNNNGSYTAQATGTVAGTVTLSATIGGTQMTSSAFMYLGTLAISPYSAATLQSGDAPLALTAVFGTTPVAGSWAMSSGAVGSLAASGSSGLGNTSGVVFTPPANLGAVISQSITVTFGSSQASTALTVLPYGYWANWAVPPDGPNNFSNQGASALKDNLTGLMWQKTPSTQEFTWQGAKDYCATLTLAGFTGWRLPTLLELYSITDYTRSGTNINPSYFTATGGNSWTSVLESPGYAHAVQPDGGANGYDITNALGNNVRCVR